MAHVAARDPCALGRRSSRPRRRLAPGPGGRDRVQHTVGRAACELPDARPRLAGLLGLLAPSRSRLGARLCGGGIGRARPARSGCRALRATPVHHGRPSGPAGTDRARRRGDACGSAGSGLPLPDRQRRRRPVGAGVDLRAARPRPRGAGWCGRGRGRARRGCDAVVHHPSDRISPYTVRHADRRLVVRGTAARGRADERAGDRQYAHLDAGHGPRPRAHRLRGCRRAPAGSRDVRDRATGDPTGTQRTGADADAPSVLARPRHRSRRGLVAPAVRERRRCARRDRVCDLPAGRSAFRHSRSERLGLGTDDRGRVVGRVRRGRTAARDRSRGGLVGHRRGTRRTRPARGARSAVPRDPLRARRGPADRRGPKAEDHACFAPVALGVSRDRGPRDCPGLVRRERLAPRRSRRGGGGGRDRCGLQPRLRLAALLAGPGRRGRRTVQLRLPSRAPPESPSSARCGSTRSDRPRRSARSHSSASRSRSFSPRDRCCPRLPVAIAHQRCSGGSGRAGSRCSRFS